MDDLSKELSKELNKDFAYCEDALGRAENAIGSLPSVQPEKRTEERTETHACDLISRQAAIDAPFKKFDMATGVTWIPLEYIEKLPSAQPEQPPYVAEIEAEYQKAVKMPHIHKPLAKALYEVWKKHDRGDAERRADDSISD